jgi:ABC-type nitrate/sulfonate/bicarbonate transport system substrate-binding protein
MLEEEKTMPKYLLIAWLVLLTLVVAAGGAAPPSAALTPITLQLQWLPQSQFCGYFVAQDRGFWKDAGLHVTIKPGAVDIVPQQVVATGGAEFGVAWLPKALASIEQGAALVNIAQVFQRSGTLAVSWKDSGITRPGRPTGAAKKSGRGALAMSQNSLPPCARRALIPLTRTM